MSFAPVHLNTVFFGLLICANILAVLPSPCTEDKSIELRPGDYELLKNRSLLDIKNNILFDPSRYFTTETEGVYRACVCHFKTCIRKCCSDGESYILAQRKCAPSNSSLDHPFNMSIHDIDTQTSTVVDATDSRFFFLVGLPLCCFNQLGLTVDESDQPVVLADGQLQSTSYLDPGASDFCVDVVIDGNSRNVRALRDWNDVCASLLPIPFLVVTFLVCPFVKELQNCHGKSLMSLVGSLLAWYVLRAFAVFGVFKPRSTACLLVASVLQFLRLASFFWMNALCFDIWWKIRRCEVPRSARLNRREAYTKFLVCSIYSWGCSFLICSVTAFVNLNAESFPKSINPKFGLHRCFFNNFYAEELFYYMPSGILLSINVIFTMLTVLKICTSVRRIAVYRQGSTNRHRAANLQSFCLYLKLLVLVVTNGAIDAAMWLRFLWWGRSIICAYVLNGVLGCFVFIVFICGHKPMGLFCRKIRPNRNSTKKTMTRLKADSRCPQPEKLKAAVAKWDNNSDQLDYSGEEDDADDEEERQLNSEKPIFQ